MISQMKISILIFVLSTLSITLQARILPKDSVGIRTINQKRYIVHKVEKGETLYALARKYNVDVQTIINSNPRANNGINIGQEILIPTPLQNTSSTPPSQDKIIHSVSSGESLFSISQKYEVNTNDIKRWNNLRSNTLSIGQKLTLYLDPEKAAEINQRKMVMENNGKKIHVVSQGETLYSIANAYNISVSDLKEWNRLESNIIGIGQELIVGYLDDDNQKVVVVKDLEAPEAEPEEAEMQTIPLEESEMQQAEVTGDGKIVTEKGMAKVIEGSESTKKYLALHRDAAIGTIMQIKNEMNDLNVFVRVIGKIPDTDGNRNILIKISKVAYDRLGAIDEQFPVEITYHP
jgi:LysM repeat protein